MKKGFIGERGFKEIIPPFMEVVEKRTWTSISTHLLVGLAAMVREFYANPRDRKELQCYVRANWVSFDRHCSTPFRFDPIGGSEPDPGCLFNSFYLPFY